MAKIIQKKFTFKMMKIIIAPNAFKNSLSAVQAAKALRAGIIKAGSNNKVLLFPVGDGGDGTGAILRRHYHADYIPCTVKDPLGRLVDAGFGLSKNGQVAIIELSDASGLKLLKPHEYNPLLANTKGTGTLIKKALDAGVAKILLCVGGSATVDGGTGILKELGAVFIDKTGTEISDLPLGLIELQRMELDSLDKRLQSVEMHLLCDVRNKLLGAHGSAATFGPQKGANENDVKFLEKCLSNFAQVVFKTNAVQIENRRSGGAAGGVAAGLAGICSAQLKDGIDYFLNLIAFEKNIQDADLIITGEGALDTQTLKGKAPYGVAKAAKKYGVPVIAVAGSIPQHPGKRFNKYFDKLICINEQETTLSFALKHSYINLVTTGSAIGNMIKNKNPNIEKKIL
jgi:glycerate 2-kinase